MIHNITYTFIENIYDEIKDSFKRNKEKNWKNN